MDDRSHTAEFKHPPLNSEAQEIRLLKILDGKGSVKCILETYEMTESLEYIALSYTWGASDLAYPITVNDCTFRVGKNLFDFLDMATKEGSSKLHGDRKHGEDVYGRYHSDSVRPGLSGMLIWIDQICINQDNVQERNHQVIQMNLMADFRLLSKG